jgi:hypothetical protein
MSALIHHLVKIVKVDTFYKIVPLHVVHVIICSLVVNYVILGVQYARTAKADTTSMAIIAPSVELIYEPAKYAMALLSAYSAQVDTTYNPTNAISAQISYKAAHTANLPLSVSPATPVTTSTNQSATPVK